MSASTYPVRVDAALDPHLSRWLWLVKWILAIPHYFVLAFLWLAFAVLSVVAFFDAFYDKGILEVSVGLNSKSETGHAGRTIPVRLLKHIEPT